MAIPSSQKSTIVRITQSSTRAAFRFLEATSPATGARWAEHFWFRIARSRIDEPVPGGVDFEVTSQGGTVRGKRWGNDGPVVYLVHGWGGNASQLNPFVRPLVAAGFTVVAHDAPSHGLSDPGPTGAGNSDGVQMGKALDDVATLFGPALNRTDNRTGVHNDAVIAHYKADWPSRNG